MDHSQNPKRAVATLKHAPQTTPMEKGLDKNQSANIPPTAKPRQLQATTPPQHAASNGAKVDEKKAAGKCRKAPEEGRKAPKEERASGEAPKEQERVDHSQNPKRAAATLKRAPQTTSMEKGLDKNQSANIPPTARAKSTSRTRIPSGIGGRRSSNSHRAPDGRGAAGKKSVKNQRPK